MQKLEMSVEREIQYMIKYQLTADELLLIKLIFYAQDGHPEYLSMFFSQNQLGYEIIDLLQSLQDKGMINKSYKIPVKGTVFNPLDVDLNKRALDSLLQHSQDMGMELFQEYPPFIVINGKTFSLRNIAKNYKSFDDFCWDYGKTIKFNRSEHERILELVRYGKENNLINSGICDFVISHQWETIELLRDEGFGTFETNELV